MWTCEHPGILMSTNPNLNAGPNDSIKSNVMTEITVYVPSWLAAIINWRHNIKGWTHTAQQTKRSNFLSVSEQQSNIFTCDKYRKKEANCHIAKVRNGRHFVILLSQATQTLKCLESCCQLVNDPWSVSALSIWQVRAKSHVTIIWIVTECNNPCCMLISKSENVWMKKTLHL